MLSDAKVRAAKPRAKPYKLTDTNRLYLLVMPGGRKAVALELLFRGQAEEPVLGALPDGQSRGRPRQARRSLRNS